MWRSIFLHEFIDHKLSNFQAVAGHATPASFGLTPKPAPISGINSVAVVPGKGFEYLLEQPLEQIIGISCHLRVSYPLPNPASSHVRAVNILSLGPKAFIQLLAVPELVPDPNKTTAMTGLFIGQSSASMGLVKLPASSFTDLRFDWHTSGKTYLRVDRLQRHCHCD